MALPHYLPSNEHLCVDNDDDDDGDDGGDDGNVGGNDDVSCDIKHVA